MNILKNGAVKKRKDLKTLRYYVDVLEQMINEYQNSDRDMQCFLTMINILAHYRAHILQCDPIDYHDNPVSVEMLEKAYDNDKDALRYMDIIYKFNKIKAPKEFKNHYVKKRS